MTSPEGLIPDMPVMPDMTNMAFNPFPTRIAQGTWKFWEALKILEPATLLGGIYANKAGYHNARQVLLAQGLTNDYSIRLADDKLGPSEKSAAVDWTFPDAQAGNTITIRKYGDRIDTAFHDRDPRLKGWREVLLQADNDPSPEGYDFVNWTTRTPDDTHKWHAHFSILRRYINSDKVYRAMLSILKGQSWQDWLKEEAMPITEADRPILKSIVLDALDETVPWVSTGVGQSAATAGEGPLSLRKILEYMVDDIRFHATPAKVDVDELILKLEPAVRSWVRDEINKTRLIG